MDNLNNDTNSFNSKDFFEKVKKNFSGPKVIFAVLGIVVLFEAVYAIRSITSPVSPASPSPLPVRKVNTQLTPAKISLSASKTSFKVNEAVPVSVMVDTGGRTIDGVDLIVKFDPKILEATAGGLIKGKILDEYPLKSVDINKSLIYISGVSNSKNGFGGTGQFALINFKAKSAGRTSLTIGFIKNGETTDSNLVEIGASKDVLDQVNNLELEVQ